MSRGVRLFPHLCYRWTVANMLMNLISPGTRFNGLHFYRRLCMLISSVLGLVSCTSWQKSRKCRKICVTWVRDHSRSSNLALINWAYTASYLWLIVTFARFPTKLWWQKGRKLPFGYTRLISSPVFSAGNFDL